MAAVVYTPINYILWIVGIGTIVFFVVALIVIYISHRYRTSAKRRHLLLQRRRKGRQFCRPGASGFTTSGADITTGDEFVTSDRAHVENTTGSSDT